MDARGGGEAARLSPPPPPPPPPLHHGIEDHGAHLRPYFTPEPTFSVWLEGIPASTLFEMEFVEPCRQLYGDAFVRDRSFMVDRHDMAAHPGMLTWGVLSFTDAQKAQECGMHVAMAPLIPASQLPFPPQRVTVRRRVPAPQPTLDALARELARQEAEKSGARVSAAIAAAGRRKGGAPQQRDARGSGLEAETSAALERRREPSPPPPPPPPRPDAPPSLPDGPPPPPPPAGSSLPAPQPADGERQPAGQLAPVEGNDEPLPSLPDDEDLMEEGSEGEGTPDAAGAPSLLAAPALREVDRAQEPAPPSAPGQQQTPHAGAEAGPDAVLTNQPPRRQPAADEGGVQPPAKQPQRRKPPSPFSSADAKQAQQQQQQQLPKVADDTARVQNLRLQQEQQQPRQAARPGSASSLAGRAGRGGRTSPAGRGRKPAAINPPASPRKAGVGVRSSAGGGDGQQPPSPQAAQQEQPLSPREARKGAGGAAAAAAAAAVTPPAPPDEKLREKVRSNYLAPPLLAAAQELLQAGNGGSGAGSAEQQQQEWSAADVAALAAEVEAALLEAHEGQTSRQYRERVRALSTNLKDNSELRAHVLRGDILPAVFVRMTAEELAKKARRRGICRSWGLCLLQLLPGGYSGDGGLLFDASLW